MVKLYLAWERGHAEYWRYLKIDGLLLSIARVERRDLPKDYRGVIFCDSGGFTYAQKGWLPNYLWAFNKQREFNPRYCATLDFPCLPTLSKEEKQRRVEITIENANKLHDYVLKRGIVIPQIVYCIQGWDLNSYIYCTQQLKDLGEYFALGVVLPVLWGSEKNKQAKVISTIKHVKKVLGDKKLHVFGLASLRIIKQVKNYIYSTDVEFRSLACRGRLIGKDGSPISNKQKLSEPLCYGTSNEASKLRELVSAARFLFNLRMLNKGVKLSYKGFEGEYVKYKSLEEWF